MSTRTPSEPFYPHERAPSGSPHARNTPGNPATSSLSFSTFLSDYSTPVLTVAGVAAISLSAYAVYSLYFKPASSKPSPPPSHASLAPSSSSPTSSSSSPVRLGTRTSQLAMWQAQHTASLLTSLHPSTPFPILGINTTGDLDQIKPLTDFGNKGAFTKELDIALLTSRIDAAVHCVKDLPTTLPEGLCLAAVMKRGDVEDVLIGREGVRLRGLEDLKEGAIVGTSAMRRRAAIARFYPHLICKDIRGNINTRIAKCDRGDYDAIILAAVGLRRLGMEKRISQILPVDKYGYAVGQGALGVLTREGDERVRRMMEGMEDAQTRLECEAERSLLRTLQGGCKVPITVRSKWLQWSEARCELSLWSCVLSIDGRQSVEWTSTIEIWRTESHSLCIEKAKELGMRVGQQLLENGGDKILADIR